MATSRVFGALCSRDSSSVWPVHLDDNRYDAGSCRGYPTLRITFKQAVHTVGTFTYRFWMRNMVEQRFGDGNQYLHHKSRKYRDAVKRKLHAYHAYIQAGLIAQGLVQYLSATYPKLVWNSCTSWLRTIRPGIAPSEFVTVLALRQRLPEFLFSFADRHLFAKFITQRQNLENVEFFRMAA
jgi:hypothetical protein